MINDNTFFLGDICEVIAGQSPPSNTYNKEGNGLPFFQGKADFGVYTPKVRVWCNAPQKIAKKGDILISVRAPVGPTNVCEQDCCIGRGLSAIRAKDKANSKYLRYFLRKIEPIISGQGRGSTFSSITQKDLKEIKVFLPLLKEQKRIVQTLDTADSLRQKRKEQLNLLDDYLKSVFFEMFGVDDSFEKCQIKDIAVNRKYALSSGPFGSNLTSKDYVSKGVIVLRGLNISQGKLDLHQVKYITEEKAQELIRSEVVPNDIVIVAVGSSGLAFKIPKTLPRAIMSQNFNKISPDTKKINPMFLQFYINSDFVQRQFKREITDTVRTFLSLTKIKEVIIILPQIELQNKFASIVEQVEQTKQKMRASLDEMDNHFNALMQRYFG